MRGLKLPFYVTLLLQLNLLMPICEAVPVRVGYFDNDIFRVFGISMDLDDTEMQNNLALREALVQYFLSNSEAYSALDASAAGDFLGLNKDAFEFIEIWQEVEADMAMSLGLVQINADDEIMPLNQDQITALGSGHALINFHVTVEDVNYWLGADIIEDVD